jgi:hypothetical protein
VKSLEAVTAIAAAEAIVVRTLDRPSALALLVRLALPSQWRRDRFP